MTINGIARSWPSKRLRILNVIRFPIGGIRSYLRYTYPLLDPAAFETTVLTADDPEAQLLPAGMAPIKVQLRLVPERKALLRLPAAVAGELRTSSYDIIHSQGTTAALLTWPAAQWRRIPHVVTLHETFRADQFEGTKGHLKRTLIGRMFSNVDALITVSDDAKRNLLEHLPLTTSAAERLHVIRNGVAVDTVVAEARNRPNLRSMLDIPDDAILLGYVGRFMPEKGFDVLVQAVKHLQGKHDLPRFVVVAMNDGGYLREYKQDIAELGLSSCFAFTGFQSSAAGALAEIDAVIMPSRREACPLLAMEAMVLGCPLIATDCIGLRQLTTGSPALSSIAGDPLSLSEAIENFLRAPANFTVRAREYMSVAQPLFDSSHTAGKLVNVFEKALGRDVC